jgi:uncharacterized membrane protein
MDAKLQLMFFRWCLVFSWYTRVIWELDYTVIQVVLGLAVVSASASTARRRDDASPGPCTEARVQVLARMPWS